MKSFRVVFMFVAALAFSGCTNIMQTVKKNGRVIEYSCKK